MCAERFLNFDRAFFDEYATIRYYLSRGASGIVYGPIDWDNMRLAVKQITFAAEHVTEEFIKDIEIKKAIWTSIEHKHLMRIHSVDLSQLPKAMFIVMEFAAGGTLHGALKSLERSGAKLPIGMVTVWAKQTAEGMLYLHQKNIVHRDLKSSNILLMEPFDIRHPHKMMLKITDFDEIKEHDHTTTLSFVGTVAYMAPEVLKTQRFSKASDVWSYGVVIWEMLSGDIPHHGLQPSAMIVKSISGELGNLPVKQSFPEDYKLLITRCWESTLEKRPSFQDILSTLQQMSTPMTLCSRDQIKEKKPMFLDLSVRTGFLCLTKHVIKLQTEHRADNVGKVKKEGQLPGSVDYNMRLKQNVEEDEAARKELLSQSQPSIYGLAILKDEVFISYLQSSLIAVYDSTTFNCKRRLTVSGLTNPEHIVSCSAYQCLYACDWSYRGMACEILRIDPHIGKVVKNWETHEGGGRLSVANDTNIILNVNNKAQLNEYTADGELLRRINLASGTNIVRAWHALKLDSGLFVVCHGGYDDPRSRVCLLSISDNHCGFVQQRLDTEVLRTFGDDYGHPFNLLKRPIYLAVDKAGSILVCDAGSKRLLLLNSTLEEARLLLPEESTEVLPWRVCVDEFNGRYLHAEYNRIQSCKLLSDGSLNCQTVFE